MAHKTKKSPTPSTAKKIGAELPTGSRKGTPSSLPPAALRRLRSVADVDPNGFHDMVGDAQSEATFRVAVLRGAAAEEIVLRGGSASAFGRLKAEIARDWTQERTLGGAR